MLNEIKLNGNFYDDDAEKLKSCFSPGVIELVEDPNKDGIEIYINKKRSISNKSIIILFKGRKKAVVKNARLDMCSRQVFMHDEFKNLVELYKIRDHFICRMIFLLLTFILFF
jgi:hypothetical protein